MGRVVSPDHTYASNRRAHWDKIAGAADGWRGLGGYYHSRLTELYRLLVPEGMRILELGCGKGELLASLSPSFGVGIDFSGEMIRRAKACQPHLTFVQADAHQMPLRGTFDVVILSDLVNDLWDVQKVFREVHKVCHQGTRIIINAYSNLWAQPLDATRKIRLATELLDQNWLTVEDITNLLYLENCESVRVSREILFPLRCWGLDALCNRFLVKLWPFKHGGLTNFIVARPFAVPKEEAKPRVSVVVPARNEAGNIERIFQRVPEMGGGTELIFVEGHSSDNTEEAIAACIAKYPDRCSKLFRQSGEGKGDAVRLGFAESTGDILMILDADMTVPPEDLIRFYEAIASSKGDFINGVRLVYPMEKEAMRFLNLLGNKFFSLAFSWLLDQPIKDTLCGTKVLWKSDYARIGRNRSYFGDFDPFGDFDLLFGAAKLNLKIVQVPIRYRERSYGTTNISRFRHGFLLLRMVMFAARKIKFV